jgi:hypothetical protein
VSADGVRGEPEVPRREQVRVDVVVGERGVLVGTGDAVDPEGAARVVVPDRAPQPCGLDQHLDPGAGRERLVLGDREIAADGLGDVGVDVERRGTGRPVARALLAADRPPRERSAAQAELVGAGLREVHRRMAPAQGVGRGVGRRVGQRGQDEDLLVPERVAVVAASGQALRRDRPHLGARAGLQHREDREAHRLLQLRVAVDLDVGALPEAVQVLALVGEQPVPAGAERGGQCGLGLIAERRGGSPARPSVREHLHDPQLLARLELRRDRQAGEIGLALDVRERARRAVDDVVHRAREPDPALVRGVQQPGTQLVVAVQLGLQRRGERGGCTRVAELLGHGLVGDELGLRDDPRRGPERLDHHLEGRDGAVREGHEPRRLHPDVLSGRGLPLELAAQHAVAHVQRPRVADDLPIAQVEGLVVHEDAEQLAVDDVDHRLAVLRVAVDRLGVGEGAGLVEPVEVRAVHVRGLALVEVPTQPDVPVGQGEDGLADAEIVEVEPGLPDRPRVDLEARPDHRSSSSARSSTTMSAPCSRRASAASWRFTPTTHPNEPARPASTPARASS